MPPDINRLRIIVAAWWVLLMQPHYEHRMQPKPRLDPIARTLDTLLRAPSMCQHTLRVTPNELFRLADSLGIDTDEQASGNWRFRPLHLLMLFLISFGNSSPSRKQRTLMGWAANSTLANWRYHIDQDLVVEHLDAPGSRQYSVTHAESHHSCMYATAHHQFCVVQLIALLAGLMMSNCTGSQSPADPLTSLIALALSTQFTTA
jgi:hypothetical protein